MAKQVLLSRSGESNKLTLEPDAIRPWSLVAVAGAVIALVGWTDVALVWYPIRLGSPEWEFGTVSNTYNALPLGTIGLAALAAAAVAKGKRFLLLGLFGIFVILTLLVLATSILYLLTVPVAWKGVQEALRPALKVSIFKTSIYAVLYLVFYGWISWFSLSRSRPGREGRQA